ncbi:MAG: class I SAM-dependent methyltransferase [Prolixibacteraceae bacterium]|jgi:ubiquinone/menaquinone biosynthesis C-methylase UbiE|nr:class I SAM-dependent methyltransferase [Prolixibacteraceae bacterium]
MAKTEPFDLHINEYEKWFDEHHFVYLSELEAIQTLLPQNGNGVEIGVGSGIFASALGIASGCDPSSTMRAKATERGINAEYGIAEELPYSDKSFDFALMVTTICFVDNPEQSFREAFRILKHRGELIVGFVDKDSTVGKNYLKHKNESVFYKDARFFSTEEIYSLLNKSNFTIQQTVQTIFNPLPDVNEIQHTENGYNKGSFVVIKAMKNEQQ